VSLAKNRHVCRGKSRFRFSAVFGKKRGFGFGLKTEPALINVNILPVRNLLPAEIHVDTFQLEIRLQVITLLNVKCRTVTTVFKTADYMYICCCRDAARCFMSVSS